MTEIVVDVSAWQYQLELNDLPADVVGVLQKMSQDTFADGQGPLFREQSRNNPRFVTRGCYHFLGPSPVQQQVDFFASVVGEPESGESLWLDWENNAITGYHPPQSDAYAWLDLAEKRWPGRVGWYSYRSNAITARQSGDFTWPLWLADPNADGDQWAAQLDATMRQFGQATIAPINGTLHNVDCNDVLNHQVLASLGGNMALSDDDIKRVVDAVWARIVKDVPAEDGSIADYPIENVVGFGYIQSLRAHQAAAAIKPGGGSGPLKVVLEGTATP